MTNFHKPETKVTTNGYLLRYNSRIVNADNETLREAKDYISSLKNVFNFPKYYADEMKQILHVLYSNKKYGYIIHSSLYEAVCLAVASYVYIKYDEYERIDLVDFIKFEFKKVKQLDICNQVNTAFGQIVVELEHVDIEEIDPLIDRESIKDLLFV